jgi:heterotetrameric sarcosine oxidase gamma subunit
MHHKQADLGATFLQHESDWVLADHFNQPSEEKKSVESGVGVHDISYLAKLSLRKDNMPVVVTSLYKKQPPAKVGTVLRGESGTLSGALCAVLTSDEALFLSKQRDSEAMSKELNDVLPNSNQLVDVTSVLGGLYLIGAKSREVLTKVTEVNTNPEEFPDGRATYAEIHRVQCVVIRLDLAGMPGYQVYFERGFGEYMWDVVLHAGREFGLVPVGTKAMDLLGWR